MATHATGDSSAPKHMNGEDVISDRTASPGGDSIAKSVLTKEELQNLLFQNIGLSKRECRDMVNAIFEEMRAALEAGEAVKLEGFGRFQPRERPKRWARNLKSGEKIAISERHVVTFHPSKKLVAGHRSESPAAHEGRLIRSVLPRSKRTARSHCLALTCW